MSDSSRITLTTDLYSSATNIASAGTSDVTRQVDDAERWGVDWDLTTAGSANVSVNLSFCNSSTGTFVVWTPLHSVTFTSTFTMSATTGATNLLLPPVKYVKFTLTNDDASTVTVNRMTLYKY